MKKKLAEVKKAVAWLNVDFSPELEAAIEAAFKEGMSVNDVIAMVLGELINLELEGQPPEN